MNKAHWILDNFDMHSKDCEEMYEQVEELVDNIEEHWDLSFRSSNIINMKREFEEIIKIIEESKVTVPDSILDMYDFLSKFESIDELKGIYEIRFNEHRYMNGY